MASTHIPPSLGILPAWSRNRHELLQEHIIKKTMAQNQIEEAAAIAIVDLDIAECHNHAMWHIYEKENLPQVSADYLWLIIDAALWRQYFKNQAVPFENQREAIIKAGVTSPPVAEEYTSFVEEQLAKAIQQSFAQTFPAQIHAPPMLTRQHPAPSPMLSQTLATGPAVPVIGNVPVLRDSAQYTGAQGTSLPPMQQQNSAAVSAPFHLSPEEHIEQFVRMFEQLGKNQPAPENPSLSFNTSSTQLESQNFQAMRQSSGVPPIFQTDTNSGVAPSQASPQFVSQPPAQRAVNVGRHDTSINTTMRTPSPTSLDDVNWLEEDITSKPPLITNDPVQAGAPPPRQMAFPRNFTAILERNRAPERSVRAKQMQQTQLGSRQPGTIQPSPRPQGTRPPSKTVLTEDGYPDWFLTSEQRMEIWEPLRCPLEEGCQAFEFAIPKWRKVKGMSFTDLYAALEPVLPSSVAVWIRTRENDHEWFYLTLGFSKLVMDSPKRYGNMGQVEWPRYPCLDLFETWISVKEFANLPKDQPGEIVIISGYDAKEVAEFRRRRKIKQARDEAKEDEHNPSSPIIDAEFQALFDTRREAISIIMQNKESCGDQLTKIYKQFAERHGNWAANKMLKIIAGEWHKRLEPEKVGPLSEAWLNHHLHELTASHKSHVSWGDDDDEAEPGEK